MIDNPQACAAPPTAEPGTIPWLRHTLTAERLHVGLASESLIEALLEAPPGTDPMDAPRSDADRRLLASVLLDEDEELTPTAIVEAVLAVRKMALLRQMEEAQRRLLVSGISAEEKQALVKEKLIIKRVLLAMSRPRR